MENCDTSFCFEREDIGVSLSKTEYYESLPSPVPNGLFYTCNFIPIEKAIYGLKGDIYKPYISDKKIISEVYKELLQLNSKDTI